MQQKIDQVIAVLQQAVRDFSLVCFANSLGAEENRWGQTLRSPLKVAAQDDHSEDAPALHLALAAGMLPSHVVQVVTPG